MIGANRERSGEDFMPLRIRRGKRLNIFCCDFAHRKHNHLRTPERSMFVREVSCAYLLFGTDPDGAPVPPSELKQVVPDDLAPLRGQQFRHKDIWNGEETIGDSLLEVVAQNLLDRLPIGFNAVRPPVLP